MKKKQINHLKKLIKEEMESKKFKLQIAVQDAVSGGKDVKYKTFDTLAIAEKQYLRTLEAVKQGVIQRQFDKGDQIAYDWKIMGVKKLWEDEHYLEEDNEDYAVDNNKNFKDIKTAEALYKIGALLYSINRTDEGEEYRMESIGYAKGLVNTDKFVPYGNV